MCQKNQERAVAVGEWKNQKGETHGIYGLKIGDTLVKVGGFTRLWGPASFALVTAPRLNQDPRVSDLTRVARVIRLR